MIKLNLMSTFTEEFKKNPWGMTWAVMQILLIYGAAIGVIVLAINLKP